jgi:hypothetical protein
MHDTSQLNHTTTTWPQSGCHAVLALWLARPGVAHQRKAMSSDELFDVLWACRVFFQGPLVVQAAAASGVFQPTMRVHWEDLHCNYNVPPLTIACSCHMLIAGTYFVIALNGMAFVHLFRTVCLWWSYQGATGGAEGDHSDPSTDHEGGPGGQVIL